MLLCGVRLLLVSLISHCPSVLGNQYLCHVDVLVTRLLKWNVSWVFPIGAYSFHCGLIEPATFRFVAQYLNDCATISGPQIQLNVDEKILLISIFNSQIGLRDIEWIELAQNGDRWSYL
jgi:hypothetical protein